MRNLFTLIMILAGMWAVRELFRSRREPEQAPSGGEEMVRDPVCGVYMPRHRARERKVNGNRVYFCSGECEMEYISSAERSEAAD